MRKNKTASKIKIGINIKSNFPEVSVLGTYKSILEIPVLM